MLPPLPPVVPPLTPPALVGVGTAPGAEPLALLLPCAFLLLLLEDAISTSSSSRSISLRALAAAAMVTAASTADVEAAAADADSAGNDGDAAVAPVMLLYALLAIEPGKIRAPQLIHTRGERPAKTNIS